MLRLCQPSPTRTRATHGSRVEEPERLGISCEFVECVSSSFEIRTEVHQSVLATNTAMPARALCPSMRKCASIK